MTVECNLCHGWGGADGKRCPACNGKGKIGSKEDFVFPQMAKAGDLSTMQGGISLRDHIAITVLPILIDKISGSPEYRTELAYKYADGMLQARKK